MRYDHVVRHGRVLPFFAACIMGACSDSVTGSREAPGTSGIVLAPITATACQYGGEPPFCALPPGTNPSAPGGSMPGVGRAPPADPGIGGGGSTPPSPPQDSASACDPTKDANCEQPLTHADSVTIQKALADHVRQSSAIADTATRRKCTDMLNQFKQSYSSKSVFRGGSNTSHYGATNNDRIHFDPWLLAGAAGGNKADQRELANTALHEAAHVMGFEHLNGDVDGVYTDPPFNLLPPGQGPCIQ